MAEVFEFPRSVKSCSDCEWAAFGHHGTYCTYLNEEIWDESWAEDCDLFDPIAPIIIKRSSK